MTAGPRPQVGDVVAWRRAGTSWAYGVVEYLDKDSAELRVIHGAPSKRARRSQSALVLVLSASRFVYGLDRALHDALAALDGAGPGAGGVERQ